MLISFATYEASINFCGSFKLKSTLFGHPFGQETMGAFLMGFLDRLYRGEFCRMRTIEKQKELLILRFHFLATKSCYRWDALENFP